MAGSRLSGSPVSAAFSAPPAFGTRAPPEADVDGWESPQAARNPVVPAPATRPSKPARRRNDRRVRSVETLSFIAISWSIRSLRVFANEIDDGLVERAGGLPQAGVAAGDGGPLRAGDCVVQRAGE